MRSLLLALATMSIGVGSAAAEPYKPAEIAAFELNGVTVGTSIAKIGEKLVAVGYLADTVYTTNTSCWSLATEGKRFCTDDFIDTDGIKKAERLTLQMPVADDVRPSDLQDRLEAKYGKITGGRGNVIYWLSENRYNEFGDAPYLTASYSPAGLEIALSHHQVSSDARKAEYEAQRQKEAEARQARETKSADAAAKLEF